jgi:hypothetical protein
VIHIPPGGKYLNLRRYAIHGCADSKDAYLPTGAVTGEGEISEEAVHATVRGRQRRQRVLTQGPPQLGEGGR